MPDFNILPSPTTAVTLSRYEKSVFPEFGLLFETPPPSPPLSHFVRDPQEASFAVILENRSEKPITAWRFQWRMTEASGQSRIHTMSGDSYSVDVFRPIAAPGLRHLISPSGCISKDMLSHVLSGGGFMGGRASGQRVLSDLAEVSFEIHLVVFEDGEIAGPDPDDFAAELQGRKPAAEFVAKQIRMARAEDRKIGNVDIAEARLRHLENRPTLPHFYRR